MLRVWLLLGAGVVILSMGTTIFVYVAKAEKAKAEVTTLIYELKDQKSRVAEAEANAQVNANSFKECSAINATNAQRAKEQKDRADAAMLRLARLEGTTGRDIEVINREADQNRGRDTVCRTLDNALPEWFVAGLRQSTD